VGTGPETVGTGPTGPGRFRFRPAGPNSKFEFKLRKMKKSHKILKNTSRCVESNGVKNFQIFVRLVYSLRALEVQLKKKKRTNWSVELLIPAKNTKCTNI
jgi:hypothetical protein